MAKILPFFPPLITSFPDIASVFSVISGNQNIAAPWICDHYINLIAFKNKDAKDKNKWLGNFCDGLGNNQNTIQSKCPFLKREIIDRKTFIDIDGLEAYIKNCLDNEYYVYIYLDLFYIEYSECFKKTHLLHPTTIYGYSDDEKYYVADFYINNKYMAKVISGDVLKMCLDQPLDNYLNNQNLRLSTQMLELYKFQSKKYEMCCEHMCLQLKDYINSTNTLYKFESEGWISGSSVLYGIQYYDTLVEMLRNANGNIDKRNFHVLYDQKVLMLFRVDYLYKNGHLKEGDYEELKKKFKEILDGATILRNQVLMFNQRNSRNLIESMIEACNRISMKDVDAVSDLLGALEL